MGTVLADSSNGLPIEGAQILLSSQGGILGKIVATTFTDKNGLYNFKNVPANRQVQYSISASAPNFSPESVTRITVDSGQVDTVNLVLKSMGDNSWVVMGKVTVDSTGRGFHQTVGGHDHKHIDS